MSQQVIEMPGNSSLMALMIPFEGAITTIKPKSVAHCSYFFFQAELQKYHGTKKSCNFRKPLRISKQFLFKYYVGHHWKRHM